ncbi:MAG: hypothetical protein M3Z24_12520 [Chloroflexota bacterium]|nr:hypothetical protein [Chloroflexota bacterium]
MTFEEIQRNLPPCRFRAQTLRFADVLDNSLNIQYSGPLSSIDDMHDEEIIAQLRKHVPNCPTCSAYLKQERHIRNQQHTALRNLLAENEQFVPSTRASIFEALHRETQIAQKENSGQLSYHEEIVPDISHLNGHRQQRRQTVSSTLPGHRRTLLRNILSLATVAVLILAAIGLFHQLLLLRSHPGQGSNPIPIPHYQYTQNWNAAIVGLAENGHFTIANYDPISGKNEVLASSLPGTTKIDGVSHDGHNVLYHYSRGGHTYYATLFPLPHTSYFYQLHDDDAGEAIWMTDNRHVLIATSHSGLVQVDTMTGTANKVASSINAAHLWFYRPGYLYYDLVKDPTKDTASSDLWRINIATGAVQQVTKTEAGHSYSLSPDGTTMFYADTITGNGASGQTAIYTVKVENGGKNAQQLLPLDATPVGFASDNALVLVRQVQGKFQVIKLKPTAPPTVDLRPFSRDVAPGAVTLCGNSTAIPNPICDQNIALAPYSSAILAVGTYADGSRKIWAGDLTTGQQRVLQTLGQSSAQVQLPGWDKIQVPR